MPRALFLLWLLAPSLLSLREAQAADPADAPVPTSQAAGRMTLPEGFKATLFAGEPDVVQPIAFTFDDRGRLWVVECNSYPDWKSKLKDRVLIFEDSDGDGRFDKRKVFWDAGSNLTGIQLGFGGVWLCSTPNLIFIADENGDDAPDGEPKVLLDGWDLNSKHNVFNGLCWGPDGWLYGLNGILSNSKVGKPGTPDDKRVAINTGVWRFHPTKEIFEAFAHGTTNPWGIDFDEYGQLFITNCVIKHLWHTVQGGHYERMFGQDIEPHSYQLMQSCADHIHWAGGPWQESRGNTPKHSEAGGGHAHAGCMVYLGDNWPDSYRGGVFTLNIHGARANQDVLERKGSGYVAHHGKDFFMANDPWFRGLGIQYGPDGGVFVTDWCDTGECHDYDNADRTNGRIYKMTYGQTTSKPEDLAKLGDSELVKRQQHKNQWQVGHARRILQERKQLGKLGKDVPAELAKMLAEEKVAAAKLRALWALHAVGGLSAEQLQEQLASPVEAVRAWTVQLALEDRKPSSEVVQTLAKMSKLDSSPLVRLYLASALQRLEIQDRWEIAAGLISHADDADDANLPLMIWYGLEPLVPADKARALTLAKDAKIPLVRQFIARRLASAGK